MNKNVTIQGMFLCIIFIGLFGCHDNLVDNPPENLSEQVVLAKDDAIHKKKAKCPVCHFQEDQGTYKKLNVNCGNPYDAHLRHGDGEIGGPVPGQEGFIFGENCEFVELITACPCFDEDDINFVLYGLVAVCETSDMLGIQARATGYAYQDLIKSECGFNGNTGVPTTGPEQNACLDVLSRLLNAYATENPHLVGYTNQLCAYFEAF